MANVNLTPKSQNILKAWLAVVNRSDVLFDKVKALPKDSKYLQAASVILSWADNVSTVLQQHGVSDVDDKFNLVDSKGRVITDPAVISAVNEGLENKNPSVLLPQLGSRLEALITLVENAVESEAQLKRIDKLEVKLASASRDASTSAKIDGLKTSLESLKASVNGKLDELKKALSELSGGITEESLRDVIRFENANLQTDLFDRVNRGLAGLATSLETATAASDAKIKELSGKIDSVHEHLDLLGDLISEESKATRDAVKEDGDSTRKTVKEEGEKTRKAVSGNRNWAKIAAVCAAGAMLFAGGHWLWHELNNDPKSKAQGLNDATIESVENEQANEFLLASTRLDWESQVPTAKKWEAASSASLAATTSPEAITITYNGENYNVSDVQGKMEFSDAVVANYSNRNLSLEELQQMIMDFALDDSAVQTSSTESMKLAYTSLESKVAQYQSAGNLEDKLNALEGMIKEAYENAIGSSAGKQTEDMIEELLNFNGGVSEDLIDAIYKATFGEAPAEGKSAEDKKDEILAQITAQNELIGELRALLGDGLNAENAGALVEALKDGVVEELYDAVLPKGTAQSVEEKRAELKAVVPESHTDSEQALLDALQQAFVENSVSDVASLLDAVEDATVKELYESMAGEGASQGKSVEEMTAELVAVKEQHSEEEIQQYQAYMAVVKAIESYLGVTGITPENVSSYLDSLKDNEVTAIYKDIFQDKATETDVQKQREALKNVAVEQHDAAYEAEHKKNQELVQQLEGIFGKDFTYESVLEYIDQASQAEINELYAHFFEKGTATTKEDKVAALKSMVLEQHTAEEMQALQDFKTQYNTITDIIKNDYIEAFGEEAANGKTFEQMLTELKNKSGEYKALSESLDSYVNNLYTKYGSGSAQTSEEKRNELLQTFEGLENLETFRQFADSMSKVYLIITNGTEPTEAEVQEVIRKVEAGELTVEQIEDAINNYIVALKNSGKEVNYDFVKWYLRTVMHKTPTGNEQQDRQRFYDYIGYEAAEENGSETPGLGD